MFKDRKEAGFGAIAEDGKIYFVDRAMAAALIEIVDKVVVEK